LVSLSDYEMEALAIPGVQRATASWEVTEQRTAVALSLLMETGRSAEFSKVKKTMNGYNSSRGPQRYPVAVREGKRLYIYIHAEIAIQPTYREDVVTAAVKKALGICGDETNGIDGSDGLFGKRSRRFNQNTYTTRITAIIQRVDGVRWVKVKALQSLGESQEPSQIPSPTPGTENKNIKCEKNQIICLYKKHLLLSVTTAKDTSGA
ncbi:MAG: hypothetical protein GY757_19765, partial [bacterium]|nr:hypothetical protein [bacterium]